MADPAPDELTRLLDERACERPLVEIVRRLDLGNPGDVADLFTPDGRWEWPHGERVVEGRDQLREYFASRPAQRTSRRLCTNVLIDVQTPTRATGTSYLVTYRLDDHDGTTLLPPPHPTNVGHYADTFRKLDGTWLLERRVTHLAFGGPTPRQG